MEGITDELRGPINRILDRSSKANVGTLEDYEEAFAGIHDAGERLSDMIGQIMSYSSIIRTEKEEQIVSDKLKAEIIKLCFFCCNIRIFHV